MIKTISSQIRIKSFRFDRTSILEELKKKSLDYYVNFSATKKSINHHEN